MESDAHQSRTDCVQRCPDTACRLVRRRMAHDRGHRQTCCRCPSVGRSEAGWPESPSVASIAVTSSWRRIGVVRCTSDPVARPGHPVRVIVEREIANPVARPGHPVRIIVEGEVTNPITRTAQPVGEVVVR